jgi:cysteine-rich repeat protein
MSGQHERNRLRSAVWAALGLTLGATSGCLTTEATTCADGLLCPPALACHPVGGGCVDPAQLAACEPPAADGDACTVALAIGTCVDGVCEIGGCGNGDPEPGEACDDGNTISGDGCRADCDKIEACGDAAVDAGEACDDGNANPADGCDACAATTWDARALLQGAVAATTIGLNYPGDVAVDRAGNIYIADTVNHRVHRVDGASGVATAVAGTGVLGGEGDGGPATAARLANPCGVAVDGREVVFIADTSSQRIRAVDPRDGVIRTVAGDGLEGFAGDGGPATLARLRNPFGVVAAGDGTLYVSDTGNHRIRRVSPAGVITTIAGTGAPGSGGDGGPALAAQLDDPHGLALDPDRALYVGDLDNHRVRRIDLVTGLISTVAGTGVPGDSGDGGVATAAQLDAPDRVALDSGGALYVTDAARHRVRRIDPVTNQITTVAGTGAAGFAGDDGPADAAALRSPHGLAFAPDGDLLIVDSDNHRLRRIDADDATIRTVVGSGAIGYVGDGGDATAAALAYPWGLAIDATGNVFISDAYHQRVRRIDATTGVITTVAGAGLDGFGGDGGPATEASLAYPWGLALDGDVLYIADSENHRVRRVDLIAGGISTLAGTGVPGGAGDGGPATAAQLAEPHDVAVLPDGDVVIADSDNHRIRRVDVATGTISTFAGGVTAGDAGDEGVATAALLDSPYGVEVEADGGVLIADSGNNRIRRVTPDGTIHALAGTGAYGGAGDGGPADEATLRFPASIAVDLDGAVLIADTFSQRVRRVAPATGVITTIAGLGSEGASGDGGAPLGAAFRFPWAVDVAPDRAVIVIDTHNHRVRRLDPARATITSIAGALGPEGAGPAPAARLTDPRAIVVTPTDTYIAGGGAGVIQAVAVGATAVATVAGRYPHEAATGELARYRPDTFGDVGGVAFAAGAGALGADVLFLSSPSESQLYAVTLVDPRAPASWTIAPLTTGNVGHADGDLASARFREPTGLLVDAAGMLYVADTGNHVIRAIDLAAQQVTTVAGTPATLGYFGDGARADEALLHAPTAIARGPGGDLFIADTGNHRVRRIAAADALISTVLGDGVAASSGDGAPAWSFPVDAPRGVACDASGNLLVTSSATVRLVVADDDGVIDGSGPVQTIYGAAPRDSFPALATSCLTGIAALDATHVQVTDACTGLLIELTRQPVAP